MKIAAFTAALVASATASQVHEFKAETHFICNVCTHVIDLANKGADWEIAQIYKLFPKLAEKINEFKHHREVIDLEDPTGTCTRLHMCKPEHENYFFEEVAYNHEEMIEAVNNDSTSTWTAGLNEKFDGASINQLKKIMGTVVDPEWTINLHQKDEAEENANIPANFDARQKWPECADVINHIRDQANCGSCWAHGTTEALNDRICIATGGKQKNLLSVADTTACCNGLKCFSFGCNGGQVGTPWTWFKSTGVVSGGDFGDNKLCYDYTMPKCSHHVTGTGLKTCDEIKEVDPVCKKDCQTNKSITYSKDKNHAKSSYGFKNNNAIKQDIMTHGSVTAAFTVYGDFPTYKSGVYTHKSGSALGGHAIKVIGWGNENGQDYWLCVNSWNNTWGDHGLFKIKAGECGIENQMHAGLV